MAIQRRGLPTFTNPDLDESVFGGVQGFNDRLFGGLEEETADVFTPSRQDARRKRRGLAPKFSSLDSPLFTGEDAIDIAAKNIIPLGELISSSISANRKRRQLPTRFARADLKTLPVRDMVRPSFAPRARVPLGSSLAERTGGQKFSDAFQTSQENQFELQNEQFKRQQEQQNIGIENQENLINTQIANQELGTNLQINFRDFARDLDRRDNALGVLHEGLATTPGNLFQSRDVNDARRAQSIIRNPESFSDAQNKWAQGIISGLRHGGRTKSKFSYGS